MPLLWVASYPHGARAVRGRPCVLPRGAVPPSAKTRPVTDPKGRSRRCDAVQVHGFVDLAPGVLWSPLAKLSGHESLQWGYWQHPEDCFLPRVTARWTLLDPLPADRCLRARHDASAGESVKFSLNHNVLFRREFRLSNGAELLQASCRDPSGAVVCVRDILEGFDLDAEASLEKMLTVALVEPLTRMLFAGELGSVLLLSRWPLFDSLWADWPPRPWAQRARGLHYTPPDSVGPELSVERLAADLRRWSSTLVDETQDEPSEDALILESHIRALDKASPHMAATYACQSWGIEPRTLYSGKILLSVVFASMGLKVRGSLRSQLKKCCVFSRPSYRNWPIALEWTTFRSQLGTVV